MVAGSGAHYGQRAKAGFKPHSLYGLQMYGMYNVQNVQSFISLFADGCYFVYSIMFGIIVHNLNLIACFIMG